MEPGVVQFKNRGMYRDSSVSKSSDEFAFENMNIRITAVKDNTLFSVTNEKGTSKTTFYKDVVYNKYWLVQDEDNSCIYIKTEHPVSTRYLKNWEIKVHVQNSADPDEEHIINVGTGQTESQRDYVTTPGDWYVVMHDVDEDDTYTYIKDDGTGNVPDPEQTTIEGIYIGRCIIDKSLILFCKKSVYDLDDKIYRLRNFDNNSFVVKELYSGDLNFQSPIECVSSYEREDIQKVYWVDGINPCRVINIASNIQPASFDFVPDVNGLPDIEVEKYYSGGGSFPAGTIQYFISYYNKLGQETKIVNATSLYYLTDSNHGVAAGDTVTCQFNISLSNLDTNFDYVRVYSAIRSTLDGPIDARIVGDYTIPDNGSVTLQDTGKNQSAIDSSLLYYIGGDSFIASTIEDKDGVLFFGNLKLTNIFDSELSEIVANLGNSISFGYKDSNQDVNYSSNIDYYWNPNTLSSNSKKTKHFKWGNYYRFGIQFITNNFEYTDIYHITDKQCDKSPKYSYDKIEVPCAKFDCNILSSLPEKYKYYRLVIAETSSSTRSVIAQGVINPTIFRLDQRLNNKPYSLLSAFTRPLNTANSEHLESLGYRETGPFADFAEKVEFSHMGITFDGGSKRVPGDYPPTKWLKQNIDEYRTNYYVDQSVVTINSPDIIYDNINIDNCEFRIVGITRQSYCYRGGEIDVNQQSSTFNNGKILLSNIGCDGNDDEWRDLNMAANIMPDYLSGGAYRWPLMSPWLNSGSISDDDNNILSHKMLSSYAFCNITTFLFDEQGFNGDYNDTIIEKCNSFDNIKKVGDKYIYINQDDLIVPRYSYRRLQVNMYENGVVNKIPSKLRAAASEYGNDNNNPIRIRVKFSDCCVIYLGDKILPIIPNLVSHNTIQNLYPNYTGTTESYWDENINIDSYYSYKQLCSSFNTRDYLLNYHDKVLYIGELYRNATADELYGNPENNAWVPISDITPINEDITETEGDTYFQRWECLRAYPYAEGDENSVVDIVSFMVETYQNLDTRYDNNRGPENLNLKRPTNFDLYNVAYNQSNNIFKYNSIIDKLQYNNFPQQFAWSRNKTYVSTIDAWTSTVLANIYNTNGSCGPINAIEKLGDTLVGFQDRAIFVINFNNRTQISTEQGLPIELANSGKVDGITYITRDYGCKNKHSIVNAKSGLYFIDDENRTFMCLGKDGIKNISQSFGFDIWFKEEQKANYSQLWDGGNLGSAFIAQYDSNRGDIYIMNGGTCLVFNEVLQSFTSFFNIDEYHYPLMYNYNGETYGLYHNSFYKMFDGSYESPYYITYRVNPEPLIEKTFTNIEYIADVFDGLGVDNTPVLSNDIPFDTLDVSTEYQSGSLSLVENAWNNISNSTKFRMRRANIPNDSNSLYGLDRIRNPWIKLKLSSASKEKLMEFHSLVVRYFK